MERPKNKSFSLRPWKKSSTKLSVLHFSDVA
jgi:hypothetical protein